MEKDEKTRPSPLFIGRMIHFDAKTGQDTGDSYYVATYLDPETGAPNGGPSCAATLQDLFTQLKNVRKLRGPYAWEPPTGVYGVDPPYLAPRRFEALTLDDLYWARLTLGLP